MATVLRLGTYPFLWKKRNNSPSEVTRAQLKALENHYQGGGLGPNKGPENMYSPVF